MKKLSTLFWLLFSSAMAGYVINNLSGNTNVTLGVFIAIMSFGLYIDRLIADFLKKK